MKHTSTHKEPQSHGALAALPATRWSVVAKAGDRARESWSDALGELIQLYRPVLVRHLVFQLRVSSDRAEDLVQTFLHEKLLEQNILSLASSKKGRLRSFILKVFSNFALSQVRAQRAQKRRPSSPDAERLDDLPERPSGEAPLADAFDALWARQVLARTLERMRKECQSKERQMLWRVLEDRIVGPLLEHTEPMPYEELVARFGLRSPSEASNLLITAKRMFARVLRETVRETVTDEREVEAEILELRRVLSK
jgi:DNA-directed RNA polymerase specialized sigma24 family protein